MKIVYHFFNKHFVEISNMDLSQVNQYRADKDALMQNEGAHPANINTTKVRSDNAQKADTLGDEIQKEIYDQYRNSDFLEGNGKYGSEEEYSKLKAKYPNDADLQREADKEKGKAP